MAGFLHFGFYTTEIFLLCCVVCCVNAKFRVSSVSHAEFSDAGRIFDDGLLLNETAGKDLNFDREIQSLFSQFTREKLFDEFLTAARLSQTSGVAGYDDFATNCLVDVAFLIESLVGKKYWAFDVLDSWGKLGSGVLRGNGLWVGNFDQCLNISAQGQVTLKFPFLPRMVHNASFEGQYCTIIFVNKSAPSTLSIVNGDLKRGFRVGACLPKSCGNNSLKIAYDLIGSLFNATLEKFNLTFDGVQCNKQKPALDSLAIFAITVASTLIFTVFLATVLHWNSSIKINASETKDGGDFGDINVTIVDESDIISVPLISDDQINFSPFRSLLKISHCFSLKHNVQRIMAASSDDRSVYGQATTLAADPLPPRHDFNVLHGLRFLSMAWIILGHTYYLCFAVLQNPLDLMEPYAHKIFFQIIIQAPYAVDTFFILSGVLLAYNFFKATELYAASVGKISFWAKFYLCRILRLTPVYTLILLLYTALFTYTGDGPFWPQDGLDTKYCRSIWWRNLLYINNLFDYRNPNNPGEVSICVGWTWYLAVDMQLFLFSPLILYPLFKSRFSRIFKLISGFVIFVAIFGGLLSTSLLVSLDGLPPNLLPASIDQAAKARSLEADVYFKPYPHIVCYVVGILIGYFCFYRDQYSAQLRLSKVVVFALWILSTVFACLVIFGLFPQYRGHVYSRHVSAFYFSCSRVAWSFSVGWVILASRFGHAGVVCEFLSWHFFVPLSRLTYCAYLLHPILMFIYFFSLRTTLYYSDFSMLWLFGSFMLFTYLSSFVFTLLVESPIGALKKIFKY